MIIRTTVIAAAALIAAQQAALAGDLRIAFNRAELEQSETAAALYRRIEAAAQAFCRKELRDSAFRHFQMRGCVADMIDEVVAEIDAPLLTGVAGNEAVDRPSRHSAL